MDAAVFGETFWVAGLELFDVLIHGVEHGKAVIGGFQAQVDVQGTDDRGDALRADWMALESLLDVSGNGGGGNAHFMETEVIPDGAWSELIVPARFHFVLRIAD